MRIVIETVPHSAQDYNTLGNYYMSDTEEGTMVIKVSDMKCEASEIAVAIHEIVEFYLTQKAGIEEEDITDFDIEWERTKEASLFEEPGDDPMAPYYEQHKAATFVERAVIAALGKTWEEHNNTMDKVYK